MNNVRNLSPETIELFEGEGYENRVLSDLELTRRLEAHGNMTEYKGLRLFTIDDDDNLTIDTTGWTLFDLLDYLNY